MIALFPEKWPCEFKLYTDVTSQKMQYLIQAVKNGLAIEARQMSFKQIPLYRVPTQWDGHDCDVSMHDAVGFYCHCSELQLKHIQLNMHDL